MPITLCLSTERSVSERGVSPELVECINPEAKKNACAGCRRFILGEGTAADDDVVMRTHVDEVTEKDSL